MIKSFVAALLTVPVITVPAMAQIPTLTGVSSGTTVQSFNSRTVGTSEVWGDFSEVGVSVNAGVSASEAADFTVNTDILNITAGGAAGFSAYTIEGGFYNFSRTNTEVTGRNVTSQTNF